jgi:hypothetical protein
MANTLEDTEAKGGWPEMNNEFGPFSVNPAQVAGLGGSLFQELVSRLLAAEVADLSGVNLSTSYQANVGDRGVDAGLYAANETKWVPAGNSAWQFKAGDLGPKGCAKEFAGATRAQEIVKQGGKYRLVLGKGLEDHLIAAREKELRAKAKTLGFDTSGDRFKVMDGNQLARWLESYPALAVSNVIRGVGHNAIDFDKWQRSQSHQTTWVKSAERDELRSAVQTFLGQSSKLDFRIEGVSGLGKTRGVLEALRGSKYEPLVLYVGNADDLSYPLIDHLNVQRRTAVVVVDECARQRHKVLAEQIEIGSPIRLITIGERDADSIRSWPIRISPLPAEILGDILMQSYPGFWPEAKRIVVANCAGNVRWALLLGEAILANPKASAGNLLDADEMRHLVLGMLSEDTDFLAFSALALFSRYGLDREKRAELESIAAGLDIPIQQLMDASRKLEQLGLVSKHGRFRSVTPQPLAVLLASHAWEELGDRILNTLLPSLDASFAERLFLRAADIGSAGPAAIALNRILGMDGPFASLAAMAEDTSSRLLIQLAIICPDEAAAHLDGLISEATDQDLRDLKSIRRNLVWTLEKLVWHSATFEVAADMLLRLALSENETFANNATGTWVGLFGGMLPATAAQPTDRIAYLERIAADESADARKLAVAAADHALDVHSTVTVSGELQGGVVVEPRGTPKTYGELWAYIKLVIALLHERATADVDEEIRESATKALIGAIHPTLENEIVRESLFDVLASLPVDARRRVWTEVNHLQALFDRVETSEFAATTSSSPDVTGRRTGLALLIERLPAPDDLDELTALAASRRWEWDDNELERRIVEAARALPAAQAIESMLRLLASQPPAEASYELGAALYAVAPGTKTLAALVGLVDAGNVAGLVGYLYARLHDGHEDTFDSFLDGELGSQLDAATRLTITVRGPKSAAGWVRVLELMKVLPVHVGAPRLFGWHADLEEDRISTLLADWLPKIETQPDYNFAVDVAAMMVYQRPKLSEETERRIAELVNLRSKFGEIGQQGWDWVQLARRGLTDDADGLLTNLLEQIEAGALNVYEGSEEQTLLREVIAKAGAPSLDGVFGALQRGSWRLQMDFRGWLANVYAPTDVIAWVAKDIQRARLVASVTGVGEGLPSQIVQFLLGNFGTDEEVASSLYGDFISGSSWGNESARLNAQISQLSGWVADKDQPAGVKSWARKRITSLKRRLDTVLEEEAEGDR